MVIVKNLTEELTKLGLVDFLRNVAKEKGLVLKETALNGTEWQMSALTSRGTEMLAISITESHESSRPLNNCFIAMNFILFSSLSKPHFIHFVSFVIFLSF